MPWLDLWPSPSERSARTAATQTPADPADRDARAAERFFRRMVGDGGLGPAAREGQGGHGGPTEPALAAELDAIRIAEPPFDVGAMTVPAAVRPG